MSFSKSSKSIQAATLVVVLEKLNKIWKENQTRLSKTMNKSLLHKMVTKTIRLILLIYMEYDRNWFLKIWYSSPSGLWDTHEQIYLILSIYSKFINLINLIHITILLIKVPKFQKCNALIIFQSFKERHLILSIYSKHINLIYLIKSYFRVNERVCSHLKLRSLGSFSPDQNRKLYI